MAIIEVNHVTKEFQLGQLTSLKDSVLNLTARLQGKTPSKKEQFRALDDVNFSIEEGEIVGIIGHNGAGKSTLLKILSQITTPTKGSARVNGKVAPLIEVGAGLIPDLTGRENIMLNSAILGIPRKIIKSKMDEIIQFAELEEFIDTPVKRYSSGMKVKLGFSIATSLDAEILIVDEVLAVGDLAFQRKCFDRMESLIKHQEKTVLLVSHNIRQVERLCSRVLLLDHGKAIMDSNPKETCNAFYDLSDKQIHKNQNIALSNNSKTKTSGDVELIAVNILDHKGNQLEFIEYQQDVVFEVSYKVNNSLPSPIFGIGIHTTDFLYLSTSQSIGAVKIDLLAPGTCTVHFKVNNFPFLPGVYSLRLGVALGSSFQAVFYGENIIQIHVRSKKINRAQTSASNEGFVAMDGTWELKCDSKQ